MSQFGVASSLVGVGFVPSGFPGAGSLKLSSYSGGEWYDAAVTPDGTGTFNLASVTQVPASSIPGSDGFVYVPPGSAPVRLAEHARHRVPATAASAPTSSTATATRSSSSRRAFMTGLDNAVGATIDPVTERLPLLDLRRRQPGRRGGRLRPGAAAGARQDGDRSVVKGDVRIKLPSAAAGRARARRAAASCRSPRRGRSPSARSSTRAREPSRCARRATEAGKIQSGQFTAGVFQVLQSRKRQREGPDRAARSRARPPAFKSCRAGKRSAERRALAPRDPAAARQARRAATAPAAATRPPPCAAPSGR